MVLAPGERGIDDGGEHRKGCVVACVEGEVLFGIAEPVAVNLVAPANVPSDGLGVRLEHNFVGVEPVAALGIVRAVNPVAVQLSGQNTQEIAVPDEVGLLEKRDAGGLAVALRGVEQAELNLGGVLGEDREIHAGTVPGGAERIR